MVRNLRSIKVHVLIIEDILHIATSRLLKPNKSTVNLALSVSDYVCSSEFIAYNVFILHWDWLGLSEVAVNLWFGCLFRRKIDTVRVRPLGRGHMFGVLTSRGLDRRRRFCRIWIT